MIEITTFVGDEIACIARMTDYAPAEPDVGLAELVEWELFDADGDYTAGQLEAMVSEEDLTRINDELLAEIEAEHQREMQP